MSTVFSVTSTLVIAFGLSYFLYLAWHGVRFVRRSPPGFAELAAGQPTIYFMVPCLNEEAVIEATVGALLTSIADYSPTLDAHVFIIDDDSDDNTQLRALSFEDSRVRIIARMLPNARVGKGMSLNHGYRVILDEVKQRGLNPDSVLVVVMDADGQLSPDALRHVLPLFDEPTVGAVQLPVRIRNRSHWLGRFQDFEFWGLSAVSQYGRATLGCVSLGGNAQFSRLTALQSVAEKPWSTSLTEDLDLTLSLQINGWKTTTSCSAYVDQQGLRSLSALRRQRTRWMQGHMMSARRLPEMWRSNKIGSGQMVEMSAYLLVPWTLVLPWSILFHISLPNTVATTFGSIARAHAAFGLWGTVASVLVMYLLSFFPMIAAGLLYYRQDRSVGLVRALLLGHLLVLYNYLAYVAAWSALIRIWRSDHAWVKTRRLDEPVEHAALLSEPL